MIFQAKFEAIFFSIELGPCPAPSAAVFSACADSDLRPESEALLPSLSDPILPLTPTLETARTCGDEKLAFWDKISDFVSINHKLGYFL